jgi:hypothetical protein
VQGARSVDQDSRGCIKTSSGSERIAVPNQAPSATGYSWVPGHYVRDDGRWKWVRGEWVSGVIAPMPQAMAEATPSQVGPTDRWVPGYWTVDRNSWVWIKGHWDD